MKILFLGDLSVNDVLLAFSKVGAEIFSSVKKQVDATQFYLYFQDGTIYSRWEKLFGHKRIDKNILRLGVFPFIYFVLKFKPKIVQITSLTAYYLPIFILSKLINIKIVFLLHNVNKHTLKMDLDLKGYNKFRVLLIELIAVKMSNIILVLSNREKNILCEHYDVKKNKIKIMSNGINLYNIKKSYNYEITSPLKVITVGNFTRLEKGLDFLLNSLELLDIEIMLTICNNKKHNRMPSSKKLNVRINFMPPLTEIELRREFVKNDIFFALSRYDSFNMSLLEAMNAGLLFIATDRVGLTERFNTDFQRFVIPFGNKEVVIEKILEIRNLPINERVKWSKRIIEFSNDYSWDKVVQQYFNIYNELNKAEDRVEIH